MPKSQYGQPLSIGNTEQSLLGHYSQRRFYRNLGRYQWSRQYNQSRKTGKLYKERG